MFEEFEEVVVGRWQVFELQELRWAGVWLGYFLVDLKFSKLVSSNLQKIAPDEFLNFLTNFVISDKFFNLYKFFIFEEFFNF